MELAWGVLDVFLTLVLILFVFFCGFIAGVIGTKERAKEIERAKAKFCRTY